MLLNTLCLSPRKKFSSFHKKMTVDCLPKFLFHGTSSKTAQKILQDGQLQPRGDRRGNWPVQPSHKKLVYLTSNENSAIWFALNSAIANGEETGEIILVETKELDTSRFVPDENLFLPFGVSIPQDQMAKAQTRILKNRNKWKDSLSHRGLIGHEGPISSQHFFPTRVEVQLKDWPAYQGFTQKYGNHYFPSYDSRHRGFLSYIESKNWKIDAMPSFMERMNEALNSR